MATASERSVAAPEPLIDTARLAEILGCSVRYVQDECAAGRFPYRPLGREYRFTPEMVRFIVNLGEYWPDPTATADPVPPAKSTTPRPRRRRAEPAASSRSNVTPLVARTPRSRRAS